MAKYFRKELPDSPVWINGAPVRFDLMETNDSALIAELMNCIRLHTGGIIEITKEEYDEELKKKEQGRLLKNSSNLQQWRPELLSQQHIQRSAVVGGSFARPQSGSPQIAIHQQPAMQRQAEPLTVPKPEAFTIKPPPTSKMAKSQ